tara:strand:+ start:1110 stop:1628 length:519 start_codon:yes stop_codon:yes gene_type:complete
MNRFFTDSEKYRAFKVYWKAYGGLQALLLSPYLSLSFIISFVLWPVWWRIGENSLYDWTDLSLSIVPTISGFTLGAISILLAVSGRTFLLLAHKERKPASYYLQLMATFFHAVIVQFLAIFLSLLLLAYPGAFLSWLAFFSFCYAIACALAAAASIFGAAQILDVSRRIDNQ